MITPAYSPTATERVLPRMALDFTTGVLDPRVTVTRALNTATRVNSSGFIEIVNANLPRFDYTPVTLAPKGLLIEEARTNVLTYSEQFDNAIWFKSAGSVTTNVTTSPDGTANADAFIEDTSTGTHIIRYQPLTLTTGVTYTSSIYVKANGRNRVRLINFDGVSAIVSIFDLSTGTVASGTGSIIFMGNGWYRITQTFAAVTTGATNFAYQISLDNGTTNSYTGNGVSGVFLYGAQHEAGAFATSYIPTTATSLTRNADAVSMTGTNFSDWYNQTQGAFVVQVIPLNVANGIILSAEGATTANTIDIRAVGQSVVVASSSIQFASVPSAPTLGQPTKLALAVNLNNFGACVAAGAVSTDISGVVPSVSSLYIGSRSLGTFFSGNIRTLAYYPQRILNAELQAFSK